ncbi:hypothetical protein [Gracilimonas tropica]|uniref:hypothetical protein n=1 Tax=Gracilimonas tropica TaxID=454600 RepID=UPI00036FB119|nr:hypothetical protein [Gracilimonas tropica]
MGYRSIRDTAKIFIMVALATGLMACNTQKSSDVIQKKDGLVQNPDRGLLQNEDPPRNLNW